MSLNDLINNINTSNYAYYDLQDLLIQAYIQLPEAHFLTLCKYYYEKLEKSNHWLVPGVHAKIFSTFFYSPAHISYLFSTLASPESKISDIQKFKEYKPSDKETKAYLIDLLTNYNRRSQEWKDIINWKEDLPELDFDEEVVEKFW